MVQVGKRHDTIVNEGKMSRKLERFGIKEIIALALISGGIFIVQKEGILDDSTKSL